MSHFALSAGATFSESLFPMCPPEERPAAPKRKPRAKREASAQRVVERVVERVIERPQRVVLPRPTPRQRYAEDAEKFDGLA